MSRSGIVLVFVGTFLAAILGAAVPVLFLGTTSSSTVISSTATESTRRIEVSANGAVYAAPDQATVRIGVNSQAATAADALKQNSADTSAVITQIKDLGVAEADVQTSDFAIYPTYDDTGTKVTGYAVSNVVVVTIRDLNTAGTLLDAVVQAGANNIGGLSFGIADPSELQAEARAKAIAAARAKAEQMAEAAGVRLGDVITMSESVSYGEPVYAREAVMADAMAVPIASGQQQISVDVYITFALR